MDDFFVGNVSRNRFDIGYFQMVNTSHIFKKRLIWIIYFFVIGFVPVKLVLFCIKLRF